MAVAEPESVEMAVDVTPEKDGGVLKEVSEGRVYQVHTYKE